MQGFGEPKPAFSPTREQLASVTDTSYTSTSPYLKVDIEGLRECALSLGEVPTDA